MTTIESILKDPKFIKFDNPQIIENKIKVVGYYPYAIKRVKNSSPKVHSVLFNSCDCTSNIRLRDSKIVLVCQDIDRFGTENFALFYHDNGIKIGRLDEIVDY